MESNGSFSGRKETGLWDGGSAGSKKAVEFTDYAVTTVNTKDILMSIRIIMGQALILVLY